jgi:hypothetical protein
MKYILLIILTSSLTICCTPTEKIKKYDYTTYELVNGKLVPTEEEDLIPIPKTAFYEPNGTYGLFLKRPPTSKDTVFYPPPTFRIPTSNFYQQWYQKYCKEEGMKPLSDLGFHPLWIGATKDSSNTFLINVIWASGPSRQAHGNCTIVPLPAYIDSTIRQKNWNIILPYRIKHKHKCLVVFNVDTVWVPYTVTDPRNMDAITHPPLDSIYHFP